MGPPNGYGERGTEEDEGREADDTGDTACHGHSSKLSVATA